MAGKANQDPVKGRTKLGQFPKGYKGTGRQPGTANKVTKNMKAMVMGALNAGKGGQHYLEIQKWEQPVAFMTLLGKFVPKNIDLRTVTRIEVITGMDPALGEPGAKAVIDISTKGLEQ